MKKVFYVSDTHFDSRRMHEFDFMNNEDVPKFADYLERNQVIIDNWNDIVTNNDIVWFLGDFASANKERTKELLLELNGEKHVLLGNHDKHFFYDFVRDKSLKVKSVQDGIKMFYDNNRPVVLSHYPILCWDKQHKGAYHVYGHTHSTVEDKIFQEAGRMLVMKTGMNSFRALNAGVMCNDYKPCTLDELCVTNNLPKKWEDCGRF